MTSSSDNETNSGSYPSQPNQAGMPPNGSGKPDHTHDEALKARTKMAPPSAISLDKLAKPNIPESEQGPEKRAREALERLRRIKVEEANDQRQNQASEQKDSEKLISTDPGSPVSVAQSSVNLSDPGFSDNDSGTPKALDEKSLHQDPKMTEPPVPKMPEPSPVFAVKPNTKPKDQSSSQTHSSNGDQKDDQPLSAQSARTSSPLLPDSAPAPSRESQTASLQPDQPAPTQSAQATPTRGLIVQSVGKQFKKRPVLRDISMHVQRGEAVGLLGPNGAGKTTSFYIVTGLIAADHGQIMLDGQDITNLPMYRRSRLGIGYLPQEASIFRGLNVEQNILSVLELVESDRDRRHEMLNNLLAEFSITHLRTSPSVALSGGERRRMEIARALASQPHFILLDEPLAGIDPIAVRDIRELVSHLKDRGIGVLITDHNVRETLDLVDRAYILHDGKVLMEGTPEQIVADEDVKRVYLGDQFQL